MNLWLGPRLAHEACRAVPLRRRRPPRGGWGEGWNYGSCSGARRLRWGAVRWGRAGVHWGGVRRWIGLLVRPVGAPNSYTLCNRDRTHRAGPATPCKVSTFSCVGGEQAPDGARWDSGGTPLVQLRCAALFTYSRFPSQLRISPGFSCDLVSAFESESAQVHTPSMLAAAQTA